MKFREILYGAFHSGLANTLKIPLTYLSIYLFIGALEPENFGILTVALSYSSLFIYVLNGGIDKSIILLFPTAERLAGHVAASVALGVAIGGLVLGGFAAIGLLKPDIFGIASALVSLALSYGIVMAASRTLASTLRIRGELRISSYHDSLLLPGLLCLGALLMSYWGLNKVEDALMIHVVASVAIFTFLLFVSAFKSPLFQIAGEESPNQYKELLKVGLPLGTASALNSGAASVCIALSSHFVSSISIAEFAIALRLNFLTLLAVTALNPFVATAVAKAWSHGKVADIHSTSQMLNRSLLLWSGLCVITLCLFESEWMSLFGIGGFNTTYALILVSLGSSISSVTSLNSQILSMSGHIRSTFSIGLVSVVVAALASLTLGPLVGPLAPAFAFFLSQIVVVLLREKEIERVTGRRSLDRSWILSLTSFTVLAVFSHLTNLSLLSRIGLGMAAAALFLAWLGPQTYLALKRSS